MKNIVRHYFPGNNTPRGFFSYYNNVIDIKKMQKISYLKGGPGTGKSTLIGKIGAEMLEKGWCVDFLHCSSDCDSLDGIVAGKKGIAIIDGTPPHGIDPVYPGAVDEIINLGEYWDEKCIRKNRNEIIKIKDETAIEFRKAYNYLSGAENIYNNMQYEKGKEISRNVEVSVAEEIIADIMEDVKKTGSVGKVRKLFATAITPQGIKNFLPQIVMNCQRIYVIRTSVASGCERILDRIGKAAVDRGLCPEAFYCPIKPDSKIDHLVIPELSIAVTISNEYHQFEGRCPGRKLTTINLGVEEDKENCNAYMQTMDALINEAITCLKAAKEKHDRLEAIYIPCMDFNRMDRLKDKLMASCHFKNPNV